jgi:large subunit ribosomal protein L6
MSRIGKKPIALPSSVKTRLDSDGLLHIEGAKGKLSWRPHSLMKLTVENDTVTVVRPNETREARSLHGLTRTMIANMVAGVTDGFERKLEIHGVGYRAEVKGKELHLALGFSHPVHFPIPESVQIKVEDRTKITLTSIDKQQLGQTAAKIRAYRPPEPYGGKGVRYSDEVVRRKEGKSGAK